MSHIERAKSNMNYFQSIKNESSYMYWCGYIDGAKTQSKETSSTDFSKIASLVAKDIINIIHDVYYGKSKETIQFRVSYGSNGAVDKIKAMIEEKYIY